jgi:hypothetical protein
VRTGFADAAAASSPGALFFIPRESAFQRVLASVKSEYAYAGLSST